MSFKKYIFKIELNHKKYLFKFPTKKIKIKIFRKKSRLGFNFK